jgi:hypothetical protein
MSGPQNTSLPKMREWPAFRAAEKRAHGAAAADGRRLPRVADLVMAHVPGTPAEKLAWLRHQIAAGKLAGDDAEEIAQAETLLAMLVRIAGSKADGHKRHLDELLDAGLKETFPASDPVAVGHFTSTEAPSRPIDRVAVDGANERDRRQRPQRRKKKRAA